MKPIKKTIISIISVLLILAAYLTTVSLVDFSTSITSLTLNKQTPKEEFKLPTEIMLYSLFHKVEFSMMVKHFPLISMSQH